MKEWRRIFHASGNQNKIGVIMLISAKIVFKPKLVTRDKKGNYIIIKGPIHQEDIIIMKYIYATLEHLNILRKYKQIYRKK